MESGEKYRTEGHFLQGGSFICYFDEKHIFKNFALSSCQYVRKILEKQLHVTNLSRVCTKKLMENVGKTVQDTYVRTKSDDSSC